MPSTCRSPTGSGTEVREGLVESTGGREGLLLVGVEGGGVTIGGGEGH